MADDLIRWPQDLQRQAESRNLLVFVGAGVSMSGQNQAGDRALGWSELLRELSTRIIEPHDTMSAGTVNHLVTESKLLEAADFLIHWTEKNGESNTFDRELSTLCDGPSSDKFNAGELHDAIFDLQPQIIVTTNFDSILERAGGEGYRSVNFYDENIDNLVRQQEPLILKFHGTCGPANRIVFSERQYANLPTDGRLAIEVLRSLLLTRMALFIGYSANDPDLKEILRSIFSGRNSRAGHVLVAEENVEDSRKELFRDCYGINIKCFPKGRYDLLQKSVKYLSLPSA